MAGLPKGINADISIHVPREGHDFNIIQFYSNFFKFQSTCPARGTTADTLYNCALLAYFNPRAPRGARQDEERGWQS